EEVIRDVRRYGLDPAVTLRAHLHLPHSGNEIGRLATTFDGMLQELTQLTHERTQNEARLALQYATARHLMEPGTLDALLPRVLRTIGEELGWEIAGFWQPDALVQRLDYRAGWHRTTLPAAAVVAWCRDWPHVPPGSLIASVLQQGEPDTDHSRAARR